MVFLDSIVSFAQWCKDNNKTYLLDQWDTEDNEILPENTPFNSPQKIVWKCTLCGKKWATYISYRIKPQTGHLCPTCSKKKIYLDENDLLTWCRLNDKMQLLEMWDYEKNKIQPDRIHHGASQKVWWKCEKGHSYEMSVANRTKHPDACPVCSGRIVLKGFNDLQTINPELANQWHPTKNGDITPSDITAYSNKKFWWQCECGHEWQSSCNNRSGGRDCPKCSKIKKHAHIVKSAKTFKEWCEQNNKKYLLDEWDYNKNSFTPEQVEAYSDKKVWWCCSLKHSFEESIRKRVNGSMCPHCDGNQTSFQEKCVFYYAEKFFKDAQSNVKLPELKGYELDIYIPSLKVAIEYDGSYFHRGKNRAIKDKNKYNLCKENGITLYRIKEKNSVKSNNADYIYCADTYNRNTYNKLLFEMFVKLGVKEKKIDIDIDRDFIEIYTLVSRSAIKKTYEQWCIENNKEYLLQQWDYSKNGCFTPKNVPYGSGKKFHFICEHGHEWQATPIKRTKMGRGCPVCAGKKIWVGYNDLATTHPELAKQWHPTKNGKLKPTDVMHCNQREVWWKCDKGHEWKSSVCSRRRDACPICNGKRFVSGLNDIATTHPELAKEWHPTKNDLKPNEVMHGSQQKVWWTCEHGHEWEATIYNRASLGRGCPYCAGRKAVVGVNDLTTVFPEINQWWHPTKNGNLKPKEILVNHAKNIWLMCEHGHEWQANLDKRRLISCPYCTNKKLLFGFNDLETVYPELAKQWHPTKNGDLKPIHVIASSSEKVWWQCEHGHEWQARIGNRVKGQNCPYCAHNRVMVGFNDLVTTHPELAKQWHPTKTGDLKPTGVSAGSGREVWWLGECGHEWQAIISNRAKGQSCPYCSNHKILIGFNDLATTHQDVVKEWHPTKNGNLKPTDVTYGSNKKVWWICEKGHEWEATVNSRTAGHNCPYCCNQSVLVGFNDLATVNPKLAKQWHPTKNGDLKPTDVTIKSTKIVWWLCECGYEWRAMVGNRVRGRGCRQCFEQKAKQQKAIPLEDSIVCTHPHIMKEWDYEKNKDIDPLKISRGSGIKAWWKCEHGHEWCVEVRSRTQGHNCPICANQQILIGFNDLATTNPKLAKEWHPTKNGNLKPTDVTTGSKKKVWWKCKHGHEWVSTISNRNTGNGCPICVGRKSKTTF